VLLPVNLAEKYKTLETLSSKQRPKGTVFLQKIRNTVRNKIREADRFIQNEIAKACKDNPKHFWKYVKAKTKSKEPIGVLAVVIKW